MKRRNWTAEQTLKKLHLATHLNDRRITQRYVTTLFDAIASTYDRFTRWFSYGMDARWKRRLLADATPTLPAKPVVLDLATGTGQLATELSRTRSDATVVGLDISRHMLAAARARRTPARNQIIWCCGDMMQLPLADGSVDLVLAAYAFRNAPHWAAALGEAARVLKPGGVLAILDLHPPQDRIWRAVFLGYLRVMGGLYGHLWHGHAPAYGYLAASLNHFVSHQTFTSALKREGFAVGSIRPRLGGGVCLHLARKVRNNDRVAHPLRANARP